MTTPDDQPPSWFQDYERRFLEFQAENERRHIQLNSRIDASNKQTGLVLVLFILVLAALGGRACSI